MPVLLAQQAAFDDGLGQLLEEQWHAVGAGEDLLEDLGRQRLAAGGAPTRVMPSRRPRRASASIVTWASAGQGGVNSGRAVTRSSNGSR